jgi:MraZ protein
MGTFRGITAVSLDAKGRLVMPVRYRVQLIEDVGGNLVLTIDTEERCLLLYPINVWTEIESKIEALSSFNPHTRRIQRLLIGHATELEMDGSGRILVPQVLREYASLDKNVMLVGQGKKFEIWDEATWSSGRDGWLTKGLGGKEGTSDVPSELLSLSL